MDIRGQSSASFEMSWEQSVPGPQVDALVKQIFEALPRAKDINAAVEEVRQRLDTLMPGYSASHPAEFAEAREVVERQFERIEVLHRHSVLQPRRQWYHGPTPSDLHWPAVREFLTNAKDWSESDVKGIDDASNEIVSLLANPAREHFSFRGLVVGHVQSGKTANMTAVAAKALDAGYHAVIVLAGLTNKLRYQTQVRLFDDLVSRNPLNWQVLTPNELDRDFRAPPHGGFLSHADKAQLVVIKKNVSPLGELRKAIENTFPAVRRQLRILVIDDECDQASINSARGELDMTAINRHIRELLSLLPAVTYVGYTATPFANVLINPYPAEGPALDDLYPRDFITALPRSSDYFGAERLFGTTPSDPDDLQPEEEGLDMIRDVPPDEEARLRPASLKDRGSFQPEMTDSLQTAILYFLASCAVRHARGDGARHMTMLVHTSTYVIAHKRVADLIEDWVDGNRGMVVDRGSVLGRRIRQIWAEEQRRVPPDITGAPAVSVDQIFDHLQTVLDAVEFPVENGASDDRIDYTGEPKTYIVVGGSILARGLTLEGLTVSYFLRTTSQYDTLLQMGRWFGYRPRYQDLPRIWMPARLKLSFRNLAGVEQEIRDEIEQYRRQNLTPTDIAVRIRAIPGMAITAANKMRAARRCAVSYWGTHRQTFRFDHHEEGLLRRNWATASELVCRADAIGLRDERAEAAGRKLWRDVPWSEIHQFFDSYSVHRTHADLAPHMLLPFLKKDDKRLDRWNLGIVETEKGPQSAEPLGSAPAVRMVNRARLVDDNDFVDIKALMSKRDLLFDCKEVGSNEAGWDDLKATRAEIVGEVPLLLLYPIDRNSEPQRKSNVRTSLDAAFDIMGFGIVFPGAKAEGGDYVSVELQPLSADEIDEIDKEEAAQAEAAGVR